jgi:hypothetical protein
LKLVFETHLTKTAWQPQDRKATVFKIRCITADKFHETSVKSNKERGKRRAIKNIAIDIGVFSQRVGGSGTNGQRIGFQPDFVRFDCESGYCCRKQFKFV